MVGAGSASDDPPRTTGTTYKSMHAQAAQCALHALIMPRMRKYIRIRSYSYRVDTLTLYTYVSGRPGPRFRRSI